VEIWTRTLADGRSAVALFNRGPAAARVEASLASLGIAARMSAVDAWAERSLGVLDGTIAADVEPHGVALFVLAALADAPSSTP
ncbi:MAG: hypothetical protein IT293_12735, partial [Deltaproteobacteria bacterium]|nr:hypothetical protein [Deltaproteobacteria bacterium]